jgi:hypothetical protein
MKILFAYIGLYLEKTKLATILKRQLYNKLVML